MTVKKTDACFGPRKGPPAFVRKRRSLFAVEVEASFVFVSRLSETFRAFSNLRRRAATRSVSEEIEGTPEHGGKESRAARTMINATNNSGICWKVWKGKVSSRLHPCRDFSFSRV